MRVPFGYVRTENGIWVVDVAAVAVVVRIYREFGEPYRYTGLSEIAHDLNADGIPTGSGGPWHARTIKYILRNPCYAGMRTDFPVIVREVDWDRVQDRLAALPIGPTR